MANQTIKTTLKREYFLYLIELRNDFYRRNLFTQAEQVQKDIDKYCTNN